MGKRVHSLLATQRCPMASSASQDPHELLSKARWASAQESAHFLCHCLALEVIKQGQNMEEVTQARRGRSEYRQRVHEH